MDAVDDHPTFRTFVTSVIVVSATFAYFAVPILRFADAGTVLSFGIALGVGAGGAWSATREGWGRKWEWPFLAAALIGLLGLTWQVSVASHWATENAERCAQIQQDMLSAHPRRPDGADIYQALGCTPRGDADVEFSPRVR